MASKGNQQVVVNQGSCGSFKLNMSLTSKKGDLLYFHGNESYLVTRVYKFKRINMFLVNIGFNVPFYEIKYVGNGK